MTENNGWERPPIINTNANIWFTSDQHYSHINILKYESKRGELFKDIEYHNEKLIEMHNNVVQHDDIVINLGDFSFGNKNYWIDILSRLNGKHWIVKGNHDKRTVTWLKNVGFDNVCKKAYATLPPEIDKSQRVVCVHSVDYLKDVYLEVKNPFILCGHVHSLWSTTYIRLGSKNVPAFNVGVDVRNFHPINFERITEALFNAETTS